MTYQLFTFPNCGHCREIKTYLDSKGIKYEEFNLGIIDGKRAFGKIYPKKVSILKKNDKGAELPILAKVNNEGELEKFAQADDIKELFT